MHCHVVFGCVSGSYETITSHIIWTMCIGLMVIDLFFERRVFSSLIFIFTTLPIPLTSYLSFNLCATITLSMVCVVVSCCILLCYRVIYLIFVSGFPQGFRKYKWFNHNHHMNACSWNHCQESSYDAQILAEILLCFFKFPIIDIDNFCIVIVPWSRSMTHASRTFRLIQFQYISLFSAHNSIYMLDVFNDPIPSPKMQSL